MLSYRHFTSAIVVYVEFNFCIFVMGAGSFTSRSYGDYQKTVHFDIATMILGLIARIFEKWITKLDYNLKEETNFSEKREDDYRRGSDFSKLIEEEESMTVSVKYQSANDSMKMAKKKVPIDNIDVISEEKDEIFRLETLKADLMKKVEAEARHNSILKEELLSKKDALGDRHLALEHEGQEKSSPCSVMGSKKKAERIAKSIEGIVETVRPTFIQWLLSQKNTACSLKPVEVLGRPIPVVRNQKLQKDIDLFRVLNESAKREGPEKRPYPDMNSIQNSENIYRPNVGMVPCVRPFSARQTLIQQILFEKSKARTLKSLEAFGRPSQAVLNQQLPSKVAGPVTVRRAADTHDKVCKSSCSPSCDENESLRDCGNMESKPYHATSESFQSQNLVAASSAIHDYDVAKGEVVVDHVIKLEESRSCEKRERPVVESKRKANKTKAADTKRRLRKPPVFLARKPPQSSDSLAASRKISRRTKTDLVEPFEDPERQLRIRQRGRRKVAAQAEHLNVLNPSKIPCLAATATYAQRSHAMVLRPRKKPSL